MRRTCCLIYCFISINNLGLLVVVLNTVANGELELASLTPVWLCSRAVGFNQVLTRWTNGNRGSAWETSRRYYSSLVPWGETVDFQLIDQWPWRKGLASWFILAWLANSCPLLQHHLSHLEVLAILYAFNGKMNEPSRNW